MTSALGWIAATWGVAMAASPILQIRRILRLGSSRDLSLEQYGVLIVGFVLWMAYGVALHNAVIFIPNVVALSFAVLAIGVALRYR